MNKTNAKCPNCSHPEADTMALAGTKERRVVIFRCLKCFNQFRMPLKEAKEKVPEFKKYFGEEAMEEN